MKEIAKGIWKLTYQTPEKFTPCSMRKSKIAVEELEKIDLEVCQKLPFEEKEIILKTTKRGVTVSIPMQTEEDIYGFGLQLKSINYAGRKRHIKVNSDPTVDTGESHAPVPFYISTAGYGVFVDTYRYATFYMGTNSKKGASSSKKEVNQPHKEFSESALYSLKRAKEQRTVIIDIQGIEGVDLYFFTGTVKQVIQKYNLFSGGGIIPPMWGLGIWYRVYGGSKEEDVKKLAEQFREEQIPMDVLGIEPGWHSHSYSCTYEWSSLFPNAQDMIDSLNQNGYHVNLWEHMFVYPAASFYQKLKDYSGEYEVWNGLVPDFATKEAREIFSDWHRVQFVEKGIAGFKLDECDNSDFNPSNWSFPDTAEFPSGMDGEQMHNAVGILYQEVIAEAFEKQGIRTLSQVRSSGALASSQPFVLYSDLYNHKEFIRGIVTSSFSGLLWSPEVRDCVNETDLLRRIETVIFSPLALLNAWRIPNPPWKQVDINKNLENIWMEKQEYYTKQCRKLLELRMSFLPYLYSAFIEYQRKGIPPVRAMVMEYPDDLEVRTIDDQYFFGKDILVCPLTLEDGMSRKVYLPEGKWHEFFGTAVYEGKAWIEVSAKEEEIPLFVRENALIPLAKPVLHITKETVFEITVRQFGSGEAEFILYEDDFETLEYKQIGVKGIRIYRKENGVVEILDKAERYRFL